MKSLIDGGGKDAPEIFLIVCTDTTWLYSARCVESLSAVCSLGQVGFLLAITTLSPPTNRTDDQDDNHLMLSSD